MGITEILRRIWLFSANKIKSSESVSKQPTQLIVELNSSLRHIIVTLVLFVLSGPNYSTVYSFLVCHFSDLTKLVERDRENLYFWEKAFEKTCHTSFINESSLF